MTSPLSTWLTRRVMSDSYLDDLIRTKGASEEVVYRQIRYTLLAIRWQAAIVPWVALFKPFGKLPRLAWEICCGKYWRASKKIHGCSNQTSGSGTGTFGIPTSQYTGGKYATPITGAGQNTGVVSNAPYRSATCFQDAGIKAGEVTAYRCWDIGADGLLHSVVYKNFVWKPGVIAVGDPSQFSAGIYAYKSILMLHNYGSVSSESVSGTVDLWGEVYEHEHGYRAQFAAISSIDDSPYYDAEALRKLYKLKRRRKKR
jgi:hypothetical protein